MKGEYIETNTNENKVFKKCVENKFENLMNSAFYSFPEEARPLRK